MWPRERCATGVAPTAGSVKMPSRGCDAMHGGHQRQILRATMAQTILRGLVANLPRQGLLRETYQLILLAHAMEQAQTLTGPRVTEFDRLFQLAVQAVAEAVADAAERESIE